MASAPWARASVTCHGRDEEVLGQDRQVDGGAHGVEVGERAAEVALRGQHGDRRGAGRVVGARGLDRVGVAADRALATATRA